MFKNGFRCYRKDDLGGFDPGGPILLVIMITWIEYASIFDPPWNDLTSLFDPQPADKIACWRD